MAFRLPVFVCAIALLSLVGCEKPGPTAATNTPVARPSAGDPRPAANAPPTGNAPPAVDPAEERKKLADLARKYSAIQGVDNTLFAGQTVPGTYFGFRALAPTDDAHLAALAKDLTDVKRPVLLDFRECKPLAAAGLAPFADVRCVSGIYLKGTDLRNLLPTVGKMAQLRYLILSDESLTNADLAPIAALVNLRGLVIIAGLRSLTAAAYKHLTGMTELELLEGSLSTSLITFTDADLAHVSKLAKLKKFEIQAGRDGELSDRGLANLKGMAGLEKLVVTRLPKSRRNRWG